MKRQERAIPGGTGRILKTISATASSPKKKGKTRSVGKGRKEDQVGKAIIEDKRDNYHGEFGEVLKGEEYNWDDEWPCLLCEVVEQMSWGTCWPPFWETELMSEAGHHAFYSDVVWDDDIWELKDIKGFPASNKCM
ncbi:hypothetical protein ACH5RR_036167 [Cinchona calisaya]|uniref:Uncharacterized protein n=1 Tax=Cinchona calisaya TaxID=153742 RepID=A0ABD2Y2K3_9GENT